jgi:hypothetical protein
MLRFEAGRDPLNSDLTGLIGELATRSPQFRKDWADRNVHEHRTGEKTYRHPEVGEIDLTYEVFDLPGENGLSICTYTAEEDSTSADKLALLAAWAASGVALPASEATPSGTRSTNPNPRTKSAAIPNNAVNHGHLGGLA